MIILALNPSIKKFIQENRSASALAKRFVGGKDEFQLIEKATQLKHEKIRVSFFNLGEYVTDNTQVTNTVSSLGNVIRMAAGTPLDNHISIDPTQAGLLQGYGVCRDNMIRLAQQISRTDDLEGRKKNCLMLDMEDAGVTDATFALCDELADQALPVAITLQAALFRTEKDLDRMIRRVKAVRLVKGAFAESADICFTKKKEIDRQFLHLSRRMLTHRAVLEGFTPVFGTHDDTLISQIIAFAGETALSPDQYEFEMLYGVRPQLQKALVNKGYTVRVYLPYGKEFWPYAVRRIGENPKNIKFLLRSLVPESFF